MSSEPPPVAIEFLWFEGCPNHETTRALLRQVLEERGMQATIDDIEVTDEIVGVQVCFPGSPTIRVEGRDVDPTLAVCDCADCSPRCRLYATDRGLRGVPERGWIEAALEAALSARA